MQPEWSFDEFKEKIFFHTKHKDDVFSQIEEATVNPIFADLRTELVAEARTIFEVSSLPFFIAFLAAGLSQTKLLEELNKKAVKEQCKKSNEVAMFILNEGLYTSAMSAVVPTFQNLHSTDIAEGKIDKLNNSIVMNAYGCLEKYSKFTLKSMILEDLDNALDLLSTDSLKIGKSNPVKLKNQINTEMRAGDNTLSLSEQYDEYILNKGYSVEQYTQLFSRLYGFTPSENVLRSLKKIESLRHILIHRNGVVDQKYIDEVDSTLSVGDVIVLTPTDLTELLESFGQYFLVLFISNAKKF